MLHAIKKNKTTYYKRYTDQRDAHDKRVSQEDEITSTVFGPLDFMESGAILRFWSKIFELVDRPLSFPEGLPIRHEYELWRKNNGIEPDAHLTFFWPDNSRFDILIEVKWRSPLSGKDQLHRQWLDYLNDAERKNCWHVFIAPEISEGISARNSDMGNVWKIGDEQRLVLVSWAQIRDALSRCLDYSSSLTKWAEITNGFLQSIGIRRFKGFCSLGCKLPTIEVFHPVFFVDLVQGFNGFEAGKNNLSEAHDEFKPFFKR